MKMRKLTCAALALCLMAALSACGDSGSGVYVQSVAELSNLGAIAPGDRFAGMVVSENVTEIEKDSDKTVENLYVKEGDDVQAGDALFSYDTDQLQLTLDKQRLELEQLKATIEQYESNIADLEKERNSAADKLAYTVQIQSLQVDLKEAELNLKSKETEVAQSEAIMENTTVIAPVTGRVTAINESGYDNYGNLLPYITIQQSGSYRIKATLGELQRGGIQEGSRMKIISRTDDSVFWTGKVTLVDYENPSQGNEYSMYYYSSSDSMTSSSKYPFYVELDSTDGLLLGQHVYLELDAGEDTAAGLSISAAFVTYDEEGNPFVWAEKGGKLEKRAVTMGEYNYMLDTIEILDGLTEEDYIAFPDEEICTEGASTTHVQPQSEGEVE